MVLDRATRRNLDLLESSGGEGGPTLLRVLDRTSTPMGARLLRAVVGQPLLDAGAHQRTPRRGRAPGRRRAAALATGRGAARPARPGAHGRFAPASSCSCRASAWRSPRASSACRACSARCKPRRDLPTLLSNARPDAAPDVVDDIRATAARRRHGLRRRRHQARRLGRARPAPRPGRRRAPVDRRARAARARAHRRPRRAGWLQQGLRLLPRSHAPPSAPSRPTTTSARAAAPTPSASTSNAWAGSASRRWPTPSASSRPS